VSKDETFLDWNDASYVPSIESDSHFRERDRGYSHSFRVINAFATRENAYVHDTSPVN